MLGNVDDLQARLVALDGDLRRISISVESPFLQPTSLPEALAQLTDDFASRTGIQPEIRLRGRFAGLTDSQHITLLGLFREALSNIRAHSDAERVTIALSGDARGVEATVTDDGQGFDPRRPSCRQRATVGLGSSGCTNACACLAGKRVSTVVRVARR